MKAEAIRDAPLGQLIRLVTRNRYFQYPEEKPDFKLPDCWVDLMNDRVPAETEKNNESNDTNDANSEAAVSSASSTVADPDAKPEVLEKEDGSSPSRSRSRSGRAQDEEQQDDNPYIGRARSRSHGSNDLYTQRTREEDQHRLDKVKSIPVVPKRTRDGAILVDWYYSDDCENPHNWSNGKRLSFTTIICLYTFVVYTSSAIYTSSTEGVMNHFGVSQLKATLGLSMYVLGYGIGPLIFSPLSEIPKIGRNPVYIITMFLFVIISIPTALVDNFAGLIVLRFFQGFFGSPCLASGGASLGDIYSLASLPYAMMAWVSAAYCGPALGPLLSGFAVPVKGWRWSLYISIWASAPVFIAMFLLMPETSGATILLRRAKRLRKLTGDERFMSQSEIDQKNMKVSAIAIDALIKPMEITIKDPAVLFVQIYTAIIYGIYYSCKFP